MSGSDPSATISDHDQIANAGANRLRGDFGAFIYEEVAELTDQLFLLAGCFDVTHQKVVTLDSMNFGSGVAYPNNKRPLFAGKMLKVKNDYTDMLLSIQKAAGVGVKYTQDYVRIVLPRMIKPSITPQEKDAALKYMVDRKIDGEDGALLLPKRFESSIEELGNLSKDVKAFCELVGLQLTKKEDALMKEIAAIEAEIAKWTAEAAKHDPDVLQIIDDSFQAISAGVKDASGEISTGKDDTKPSTGTKGTSSPSVSGAVAAAAPTAVLQIFYAEFKYGMELAKLYEALEAIARNQRKLDNKRLELKHLLEKEPEVSACASILEESVKLLSKLSGRFRKSLTVFQDVKIDAANLRDLLKDDTISKEGLRQFIDNAQAWNIRLLDTLQVLQKTQRARDPLRETTADRMKRAKEKAEISFSAFATYFIVGIGELQDFFSQGQTKKYNNPAVGQQPARRPNVAVFYDLVQGASLLTGSDKAFVDLGADVSLDVIGIGLPLPYIFVEKDGQKQPVSFAQSSSPDWLWKFAQTYRNEFEALALHQSAVGASWWETLPDLSGAVDSLSVGRFSLRLYAFALGQAGLLSIYGKSDLDRIFEEQFGTLPDTLAATANTATNPEDLDEKYASVPAAAAKLSSQLGKITDNTEVEIGKLFPNGNPEGTTLATDLTAFAKASPATVWSVMKDVATRLHFNGFKHLYVLNVIQLVLLCPETKIVLENEQDAPAIVQALEEALADCQEPLHDAATGATLVNSAYEFAARCPNVPAPLMAYCLQLALFDKLIAKSNLDK